MIESLCVAKTLCLVWGQWSSKGKMGYFDVSQGLKSVLMMYKRYKLLAEWFFCLTYFQAAISFEEKVCNGVKGSIRSLARTSPLHGS